MTWYKETGPKQDMVISGRIRIARNLKGVSFPHRLTGTEAEEVAEQIVRVFPKEDLQAGQQGDDPKWRLVDLLTLDDLSKRTMVERYLISSGMLATAPGKKLIVDAAENKSLMIMEEDHIRAQVITAGFAPDKAYRELTELTNMLEQKLNLAWDDDFGFLTACPTNTGTGMRVSVMMHLPGIIRTNKLPHLAEMLGKTGYVVRGAHGEGSKAEGDRVQISNQITLGISEKEILAKLERLTEQIIDSEAKTRKELLLTHERVLADEVWRAYGILTNARSISQEEATDLLSRLRLGVALGFVEGIAFPTITELEMSIGRATVQRYVGESLDARDRDEMRAKIIRQVLKA